MLAESLIERIVEEVFTDDIDCDPEIEGHSDDEVLYSLDADLDAQDGTMLDIQLRATIDAILEEV